ncbi:hypothetical protein [Parabacteroides leei]|jgi:hypothetical protein|uniref:hypothetical protein n=1 Tax=Parabacteroides leei TaxID=2939491 RepID=UPI0018982D20|nr:hypothetical protein [Parabacteroides goldsteinii]MDD4636531.1 hypothetical protein [Bacteroidales bacterium]
MHRILLILIVLLSGIQRMSAQYYRINHDAKTIAAMSGAYGSEATAESYYNEQVKDILKHYQTAEAAIAGIYGSKYLDRKALTTLGLWASAEENYYYKRVYNMVSAKIMPKIWTVSGLMLQKPANALYWGSYLMKTCDDTKNLCMQFESVVTNSRLSFKDIAFLELTPEMAAIFDLTKTGMDWKPFIDNLSSISGNFTKENLVSDIDKLYNTGIGMADSGASNVENEIVGNNSLHGNITSTANAILNIAKNSYGMFNNLKHDLGGTMIGLMGGKAEVNKLFNLSDYNLTSWLTDYNQESLGRYYTQRWYIYRRDSGSDILCDYMPPTDDKSVINGSQWTRFDTSDPSFYPNSTQIEQILRNSENYAGWSRDRVSQLNRSNDGNYYYMDYWLSAYLIKRNGKQTKKSYAYNIKVTKSWNRTEEIYEDYFDSYSMDLNTFTAQLYAKLSEYNDNENGYTYYIGSDSKNYYQATDAAKLKGTESVIISVTCSDGVSLGEGTTQYKCRSCGGSLNNNTKECVMQTTLSGDNELDTSELDEMETDAKKHIVLLEAQINALEKENSLLIKQIATASIEDAAALRQKYNANKTKISELESELAIYNKKLEEISQAKAEANQDNSIQTDDYYRIPAIMQDCKTAYNLTWQGDGWWEGYTYYRKATMPNIKGIVTFKAVVSIARKPKYFLGIKIHRAIIQISWNLTSEYTDTEVVDVLELNPEQDEKTKVQLVNNRISEIARQYPKCQVSTEYIKTEPAGTDDSEDTYHLLWSSDRLEIAREIDSRLTKIYSDLVSMEKMLHYRLNIVDVWNKIGPYINDEQGRRKTILEQCHDHWMEKATEVSIPNRRKEAEKRDNTPGNMTEPTPSPGIKKEDVEP